MDSKNNGDKMRHFYIRAKVFKGAVSPWNNRVTYDADGFARVPIGCVAIEYNDDVIVDGPEVAYNLAFAFVSPEDNFDYHVASNIARGRLKAGKGKYIHGGNFQMAIERNKAHDIFEDADFHHKFLRYIDPELFAISARACLKKIELDRKDAEKAAERDIVK
jgi:hypothetical protein